MAICYLHLGSNIGNKKLHIQKAVTRISELTGDVLITSSLYETEPWGKKDQEEFVNAAIKINTSLNPIKLLDSIKEIENELGRRSKQKWYPRIIDIDILFYENLVLKSVKLEIPHKHLHERNFVIVPLLEIANNVYHPYYQKTIEQLSEENLDKSEVKKVSD